MPLVALSLEDPVLPDLEKSLANGRFEAARLIEQGLVGRCYWNSDAYVAAHGGRVVHGWQAMVWPGLYILLLHHAVVETPEGELLDVTICPAPNQGVTAFLRDESIIPPRDYPIYVPNRYLALSTSAGAQAMADANAAQLSALRRLAEIARAQDVPFDLDRGPRLRMTPEIAALCRAYERSARAVTAAEALCRSESGEGEDEMRFGSRRGR